MPENATQQKPNVAAGDSGNAGTRKAKLKTEFWRATETNSLTRQACQKSSQLSKPKPKPNKAKVKAKLQMRNGSPDQTKKLPATTKADEGKPKPETYTKESLTLR